MRSIALLALLALLASVLLVLAAEDAQPVTALPGLVAWYDISTLHENTREGATVDRWEDSSGNGHTLVDRRDGESALFKTLQVEGQPAVLVREANTHALAAPFELDDHTVFLVVSTRCRPCALFHSTTEGKSGNGILLRGDGDRPYLHVDGRALPYTDRLQVGQEFVVLVLGREADALHGFVNDRDVSSLYDAPGVVQAGIFFNLPITRAVTKDGNGLRISEMIVFDSYLEREPRAQVTRYLGEKYGIELHEPGPGEQPIERIAPPRAERVKARLGLSKAQNVNRFPSRFVFWDLDRTVEEPFRRDREQGLERLYCTRDATSVRIRVVLPLSAAVAQASVRVSVVKNDAEWLPEEASSGPLAASENGRLLLDAYVELDAGDWIAVVTEGEGAKGEVSALPEGSELIVEVR